MILSYQLHPFVYQSYDGQPGYDWLLYVDIHLLEEASSSVSDSPSSIVSSHRSFVPCVRRTGPLWVRVVPVSVSDGWWLSISIILSISMSLILIMWYHNITHCSSVLYSITLLQLYDRYKYKYDLLLLYSHFHPLYTSILYNMSTISVNVGRWLGTSLQHISITSIIYIRHSLLLLYSCSMARTAVWVSPCPLLRISLWH